MPMIELAPAEFVYRIHADEGLTMEIYSYGHHTGSWVVKNISPEFIMQCGENLYSSGDPNFRVIHSETTEIGKGVIQTKVSTKNDDLGVLVDTYFRLFPQTKVLERWSVITNIGQTPIEIGRFDTFCLRLPGGSYQLRYFQSSWGKEFSPVIQPLTGTKILEGDCGRSSGKMHPWFALENEERGVLISTIAWSGNWIYRFEPQIDGSYLITGGINPWLFSKRLAKGQQLEGLHILCVLGEPGDIDNAAVQLTRWGRKYWYPQNDLSRSLPVEWNHWWPYTDVHINSDTFKANVDTAAELGVEVCTLDAGWFGPDDEKSDWYNYRGDWNYINRKRFPDGIRNIADYVHNKRMKFGLWCEIEGVGKDANLNKEHPEFIAMRDGKSLGSICLGNPDAEEWAFKTIERLIVDCKCDWIKIDYNIDVGAGCNRTDHGHDAGDGLYEHYRAYYRLLSRIKEKYPDVLLENCSSGGLRIDLGILKHTHLSYLSDPDMPVHSLQLFWGATMMMAPNVCLHWPWSHTIGSVSSLDLTKAEVQPHQLDYYFRIGMLNAFGYSHRLPELPRWIKEKITEYTRFYQQKVKRFVQMADLYHLTGQPLRDGSGDRWCAFEYLMPDQAEGLVFIFRLPGAEPQRTIQLKNLLSDKLYNLRWQGKDKLPQQKSGSELMSEGLLIDGLLEEDSVVLFLKEA